MTWSGNSAVVAFGPGKLFVAPLGSTEPTDLTTAWDAAWIPIGYTKDGSTFSMQLASAQVEVAEELAPIKIVVTGRTATIAFNMSQLTAKNLKTSLNGGTITSGSGIVTFDPPTVGQEVRVMLGWEADAADERWIYRQCIQTGNTQIQRQKGANNAEIAVTFSLEKPTSSQEFRAILATARA